MKLLRRFISIFGNYDPELVRKAWVKSSTILKNELLDNNQRSQEVYKLLYQLLNESIYRLTGQKVTFILKHCNEGSFSANDASKFIDKLKLEGCNTKLLFLDYLDMMIPSSSTYNNNGSNDYNTHGQILHELRLLSRNYNIPVVTITQNQRAAENIDQNMGNSLMG